MGKVDQLHVGQLEQLCWYVSVQDCMALQLNIMSVAIGG